MTIVGTIIKIHKLYYVYDIAQDNKTPLHFAAKSGDSDVVQALLDRGAAVEVVNKVTNYIMCLCSKNDE